MQDKQKHTIIVLSECDQYMSMFGYDNLSHGYKRTGKASYKHASIGIMQKLS